MHPIIAKTFGGLSKPYYFRHFVFGLALAALCGFVLTRGPNGIQFSMIAILAVNAFLYPYARFVYESVVRFIMGENLFILPIFIVLFAKYVTMALCFTFAILIAPIGLAYLYYHHSKQANQDQG